MLPVWLLYKVATKSRIMGLFFPPKIFKEAQTQIALQWTMQAAFLATCTGDGEQLRNSVFTGKNKVLQFSSCARMFTLCSLVAVVFPFFSQHKTMTKMIRRGRNGSLFSLVCKQCDRDGSLLHRSKHKYPREHLNLLPFWHLVTQPHSGLW